MNRRTLADNIDTLDEKIAELQREKAEFYAAYREEYEKRADRDEVKLEVAAVKAAIRQRQRLAKDKDAVVEKDDRADEILLEITGTPVATRTRATRDEVPEPAKPAPIDRTPILSVIPPDDLEIPPELDRRRQRETA